MRRAIWLAAVLCLGAGVVQAAEIFSYDFEGGADLAAYPELVTDRGVTAEIVAGGPQGDGHCVKVANTVKSRYCQLSIKRPMTMQKNLLLSFDHREQIVDGKPNYLGIIFNQGQSQWYSSDTFSDQWRHVELAVGDMSSPTDSTLALGQVFDRLNLYGRADNDAQGLMTVWLDNIKLETRQGEARLSDQGRISYSNPPFFGWGRTIGRSRLEYCQDPTFPADKTVVVETDRDFHMPSAPLAPGVWYWKVLRQAEFADSWTNIQRMTILPESHRFTTPPVPEADIGKRAHPRLIFAKPAEGAARDALIARAKGTAAQGVNDDPPPYAPGNPEWPTWIDWYGKVHGGITSASGVRLQRMAELYVQTQDSGVRDALKQMAFKAASWDPNGGSAMKNGDIGAQHFLRGLNWAYDALYNDLTTEERAKLREAIVARGEQFWRSLNPFKTGQREYNNHAWLCTLALGETGLVLMGEDPRVDGWAEYSRELYLGLYLCGLGWQGDNNEGIAYWGYGLGFVISYGDMMKAVCGIDLFQHPWLYQTARFPMYTAPPGAWAVSFADTGKPNHSIRGPAETAQVKDLAMRTGDRYALWYGGGTADEAGFDPRPPVDLPQSILYRFIGWSVFNTSLLSGKEGVTVALRSGPFWAGHQHEDQNSFVIHAYGEKLAIDSGYYDWYGSPHFTQYSVLTRAHNAIVVDGKDQDSRKPGRDGQITAWFDSPGYGYTVGRVRNDLMYEGRLKGWDRQALFIKPGFVIVHDVLSAATEPAQYDWLLHTVAPIDADAASQSFRFTSGAAGLNGRFLAPQGVNLAVKAGYPVEPVDGYSTRPVPPDRYSHEWTLTATPTEKRLDEDFLVAMQIQHAGDADAASFEAVPAQGGLAVQCKTAQETTVTCFRGREGTGPLQAAGISSDAAMFSVTTKGDGGVVRAVLVGGTYLQREGTDLIRSVLPGSYSVVRNPVGTIVNASVGEAGTVAIFGGEPRPVNAGDSQFTLEGGADPAKTRKLERGGLTWEGARLPVGEEVGNYWWTSFTTEKTDRCQLTIDLPPTAALTASLDSRPLTFEGDANLRTRLWLNAGRHLLLLGGPATLPDVKIEPENLTFTPATMLPQSFRPGAAAVMVEGEKPSAESEVKAKVVEKVAASGGVAHVGWDTLGQWAEWTLEVPAAGDYQLLVRGCSEYEEIMRELQVDPGTPAVVRCMTQMQGTGGFCRVTDDWRYFLINDADGRPLTLHLPAGRHVLRMEHMGGSMNIDLVGLQPVK
jgi:hypothetical protein